MELSVNIELLFTEAGEDAADRVRAAADAGIATVEIWQHSNKDLESLGRALDECGSVLWTLLIEHRAPLALRDTHAAFLEQVEAACRAAHGLGCRRIVTGSGVGMPFMRRPEQTAIVVEALKAGAEIAARHDVVLVLENLNTRVDHAGTLFDHTSDCVEALRAVASPHAALLYDLYHSLQMREHATRELVGNMDLVSHVQIADLPDRTEPGTGRVDWAAQLGDLRRLGYDGPVGLECWPTTGTLAALEFIRATVNALD